MDEAGNKVEQCKVWESLIRGDLQLPVVFCKLWAKSHVINSSVFPSSYQNTMNDIEE